MSAARRRFRFIKEIAEGGFGKVYLAEQLSSDGFSRIVAVKLLHAKWSSHDEIVMRTRDEARLLGLIRHQHIVKVEDLTSIDGKCAIVMEYLEGVDLKYMLQFLRERNEVFPRAALFECMLGVVSALDAAYNGKPLQGGDPLRVIHRDIKPSNIFVTVPGAVKVLDFGTARANFAEREAKTQALAFGSQGYMAPERMLGEEDTPAADIFSLGVTLYELLTFESFGRIPPRPNKFLAKVQDRVAAIALTGDPQWQDQVRETLRQMLAYEPASRPSAAQLVDTFEVLAQNSKDTALRKFCRTSVAEAKQSEPDAASADPLTGQVVDEDASAAFGLVGGIPTLPGGVLSDPPANAGNSGPITTPREVPSSRPGSMNSSPGSNSAPVERPGALASSPAVALDDAPKASGGKKWLWIVVALVVLGGGFLVVAGGAAVFLLSGDAVSTPAPVEAPKGEDKATAPSEPAAAEAAKAPAAAGGIIETPDSRTGIESVKTVLNASFPEGAEVVVNGSGGFRARWDGKADFDMGAIPVGKYRANLTPAGGKTVRAKVFEVVAGKQSCAYNFDTAKNEWSGACN
jgi:serine/threonine protein kinase